MHVYFSALTLAVAFRTILNPRPGGLRLNNLLEPRQMLMHKKCVVPIIYRKSRLTKFGFCLQDFNMQKFFFCNLPSPSPIPAHNLKNNNNNNNKNKNKQADIKNILQLMFKLKRQISTLNVMAIRDQRYANVSKQQLYWRALTLVRPNGANVGMALFDRFMKT